jgi:hypothetical protein
MEDWIAGVGTSHVPRGATGEELTSLPIARPNHRISYF